MRTELPRIFLEMSYEKAAREYLRRLPPEHFMEATPQATQREITLESLALVKAQRPDVQVFNELLVQYPLPRRKSVKPNAQGRFEIPELELEVGFHGGWMRYWWQGELLPLPAELQAALGKERQARLAAEKEVARLREELARLKEAT